LYERDLAGRWTLFQKLLSPIQEPDMYFGSSLCFVSQQLIIGTRSEGTMNGALFAFSKNAHTGMYEYTHTLIPPNKTVPAPTSDGNRIVPMGSNVIFQGALLTPDVGLVFVWKWREPKW